MPKPTGSRARPHELGALQTAKARLVSGIGTQWRWLGRERFPLPMPEAAVWRALERSELVVPTTTEQPEVSVVIPVYGQLATTFSCLESIAREPAGKTFEVIVADDRSPDRTREMLSRVRGIRVLENPENLGFLRSVNRAAREARGEWLCLLNNDTRVTAGWLAELVQSFELFPRAGLVGAKLLFPDGRLQEAGGTLFRDGTASHYGRRQDPARPEFSFARRVDYCSAACAVIPKRLWDELGGFDEYYVPAYYEDTDLAFRVRRSGYEVIYQPACRVVHYEGITHGKAAKNPDHHQVKNRTRFFERWSDVLLREHSPPETRTWRTADRRSGPGLLLVTGAELARDDGASSVSVAAEQLDRAGLRVSVFPTRSNASDAAAQGALQRRGIEVLYAPYAPALSDLLRGSMTARFDVLFLWGVTDARRTLALARRAAGHLKVIAFVGGSTELDPAALEPFDALVTPDEASKAALVAALPHARVFVSPRAGAAEQTAWQCIHELVRAPERAG